MQNLFSNTCAECSKIITQNYSTSFTMGIKVFDKKFQMPVYAIYGFVRFADEIVDTFHGQDKEELLHEFKQETRKAIERRISLNPVLHAFQEVVHTYHIEWELIDAFLKSMEMDLYKTTYTGMLYNQYIYGSAEVVGLMCLRVFCEGDSALYDRLKEPARRLGAAFQKVNFLRDMKSDFEERGRVYFPDIDFADFNATSKQLIEQDIRDDFDAALAGIMQLPKGAQFGVYTAYKYYLNLFYKITQAPPQKVLQQRIRVPNHQKMVILVKSILRYQLNVF
ncbi:phytoene/squalene synthase family protein [Sphingobacteriales bacterium UPWRP_1]|nr:phytoene synthase [Sphingobacteriales bacterium TSM_CSM]PSJ71858.1 phytoene/squalene synthase family protein [Sphingobacteriales bacterium UPWRP_1]